MTYQGRSLDDLPLAAYTTGVAPKEADEAAAEAAPQLTQQEAIARAMGAPPPPAVEPAHAQAAEASEPTSAARGRPRLPKLRLPKVSLPALGGDGAAEADWMKPAPAPAAVANAAPAIPGAPGTPAAGPTGTPASGGPFAVPNHAGAPFAAATGANAAPTGAPIATRSALDLRDLPGLLRNPREAVREPRILFGGLIAIGAILLVVSLLGQGGSGGVAGDPNASNGLAAATAGPPPGVAKIEFKGDHPVVHDLTGRTGSGAAVNGRIDATWSDLAGNTLGLSGRAGSGTRTTSAELVLTLTTTVDGDVVTFESLEGECTVGMASQPSTVTGSYVCKKLESTDGKQVIDVSGTYRT